MQAVFFPKFFHVFLKCGHFLGRIFYLRGSRRQALFFLSFPIFTEITCRLRRFTYFSLQKCPFCGLAGENASCGRVLMHIFC